MVKKTPTPLTLVRDEEVVDAAATAIPDTITETQPPQPAAPLTVGQQIGTYAALTAQLKRQFHLNEQTIVKLFELALNERFTLIQMGLAGPRSPIPATPEDLDWIEGRDGPVAAEFLVGGWQQVDAADHTTEVEVGAGLEDSLFAPLLHA